MSLSHSKHGVQRSGSRELIGKSHISSQTIRLGRQISSFHNEKAENTTCSCVLALIVREMIGPCLIWDRKHKRRLTMWEGTDATKYFNQATEISVHKTQYSVSSGWHPMENGQQWAWLVTNALFQDHPRRNTPQRACENGDNLRVDYHNMAKWHTCMNTTTKSSKIGCARDRLEDKTKCINSEKSRVVIILR